MIEKQISTFLIAGLVTLLVDFSIYRILLSTEWIGPGIAKAISFLAGTAFAYYANRHWTFKQAIAERQALWRFLCLYGGTLTANVLLNRIVLVWLGRNPYSVETAFVSATALSALLNFLGMKFFVFRTTPKRGIQ